MSCQEQQEEEVEVLQSIYDGDSNFKQLNNTTYQYKYGEEGSFQTFLLELQWGESYPDEAPVINLDLFYNKHLVNTVREAIQSGLEEQIPDLLGTPMTFSLFEWVKDNLDTLLENQPNAPVSQASSDPVVSSGGGGGGEEKGGPKKEKKEQLSKQQKRRLYDRFGGNMEERPRGWNWVDVIKHLSQTGGAKPSD
ncbi:RWD domain-containing protein 4-like [Babylonia areolata]|uniref:RWD domain-containing protein 4-like n=1 Tax=Babylonia areolata TaxID=304850 RepID=UPI003FD2007B